MSVLMSIEWQNKERQPLVKWDTHVELKWVVEVIQTTYINIEHKAGFFLFISQNANCKYPHFIKFVDY